jgi:plasmid stabilization system protein ParE
MYEKYFIKWAAPARGDLDEIIEYIAQTNITYAVKVLNKIELAVKNLDTFPKRGRIVPELERYGYILYREIIVDSQSGLIPRRKRANLFARLRRGGSF